MTLSDKALDGSPRPLGVHSLDHFSLDVPCLETARDFYASFGLDARVEGDALVLRCFGDGHAWARLYQGPKKRLRQIAFGAWREDLGALRERVEAEGIAVTPAEEGIDGFRFVDPDGNQVEVRVAAKVTPDCKSDVHFESVAGGERGSPYRRHAAQVQPRRLSHIMLFTPDLPRAVDFYGRALGIRLSDRSEDIVAFMHTVHGADHHTVAFAQSSHRGFHHCSWDVASLNEVGLGAMRMVEKGWKDGWGFGRHVLGSNYFYYVRDPWGSYSEYSCDIDYVPAGVEWQAGNHPPEDSLYLWGPDVPAEFIVNHEEP
ncbi:3,4-dihydroxyphenylacetate 2,3-dioxygenase [compost metagenome]|uniref:Catechol-2,3-dioxygenase n=1 Tax=Pseudomonas jinjuensis TaxID=198616 RepID=A0A1H0GGI8_9PSED|nr:VOC family protein [Pseudomonas jinjuensis]SDO05998.1 Catechol-2,3-dioxygenase [Pseudomonas jinjuensis]